VVYLKAEFHGEAHRAHQAQGVLVEALARFAHGANDILLEVGLAAIRIN